MEVSRSEGKRYHGLDHQSNKFQCRPHLEEVETKCRDTHLTSIVSIGHLPQHHCDQWYFYFITSLKPM